MFVVFAPAITPWFAVELRSALLDSYPSHGGKQLDSFLDVAVVIPCRHLAVLIHIESY